MKNEYEVNGELTTIYLDSPKYGRICTFISTSDLEKVKSYPNTWFANWSPLTKSFYVSSKIYINGKRVGVKLHRWIMEPTDDMQVDHINHDTLDNTRANLRIVEQAFNKLNKNGAYTNNKIGVRGVCWHERDKHWRAQVQLDGHKIYLGSYSTKEQAEAKVESVLNKLLRG